MNSEGTAFGTSGFEDQSVQAGNTTRVKLYGNWVCREWNCQHKPQCRDKWACQREWEYRNKMQCKHKPKCRNGDKCRYNQCICPNSWWRPRHAEYCQEAWVTQNNWNCKHLKKCNDRQNCQHETKSKDDEWVCQHEIKKNSLSQYKCESEWVCRHKCQSERECQHEWQCQNGWQSAQYTREELIECLKKTPEEQIDFFKQPCKKCKNESSISSFLLYKHQPESLNKKPDLEIVCHLVWNNFYRVFGDWKCNNCKASWESAYTWISLQKFIEKTRGGDLIKEDFYVVESCKEKLCKRLESTSILKEFKPLTQSKSKKLPHRRDLCQKCLHYENCTQTGVYFGYQNSQKK
ncbi:11106_t:CDS:2 [Entrophospora sp. SA101]|nr:11106_t:CDS:2 [Entrophospora sp. SA101]